MSAARAAGRASRCPACVRSPPRSPVWPPWPHRNVRRRSSSRRPRRTPRLASPTPTSPARPASPASVTCRARPTKDYIIEVTGSGVALVDYDNDGLLDIYLVNGSTLDLVRQGRPAPRAALFRNAGGRTFTDVTGEAGVANERWGQGVCAGDYDNDGFQDVYVTNFGRSRLYRNLEGRRFEDVAERAGRGRGQLDDGLRLRRLRRRRAARSLRGGVRDPRSRRTCRRRRAGPRAHVSRRRAPQDRRTASVGMGASYTAGATRLHVSRPPGDVRASRPEGRARSSLPQQRRRHVHGRDARRRAWTTRRRSVRLRRRVVRHGRRREARSARGQRLGPESCVSQPGHGRFRDVSYPSGAALDGNGREQAHMGVAIGDYDNDGRDDVHITNFADDFNVLYRNEGGSVFEDVSFKTGVARVSDPVSRMGHELPRLRQRRLARSARRQRARLPRAWTRSAGTRRTRSGRCCCAT